MQFKEQGIAKQDIGNFIIGVVFSLLVIASIGWMNTVYAAQPSAFVQKQQRIAQSNGVWVAMRHWARVEPVVVPLDYAGISAACPMGKGWTKVHITFSSGKKEIQWCDIKAAYNSSGCFNRADMHKRHAPNEWLDSQSVCEPGVHPLIDFVNATEAQLEY